MIKKNCFYKNPYLHIRSIMQVATGKQGLKRVSGNAVFNSKVFEAKNFKLLITIFLLLIIFACSKEPSEPRIPEFEIPVIHGYYARDEFAMNYGAYGYSKPNVKLGNQSNDICSEYFFCGYPNPTYSYMHIITKTPGNNERKTIWLTHALLLPPFNSGVVLSDELNNFYAGSAPLLYNEFTSDFFTLNVSSLPDGYYRLYLKANGHLLYDNIVLDRNTYN